MDGRSWRGIGSLVRRDCVEKWTQERRRAHPFKNQDRKGGAPPARKDKLKIVWASLGCPTHPLRRRWKTKADGRFGRDAALYAGLTIVVIYDNIEVVVEPEMAERR